MEASEKLFLEKYGNKITASESWVIRFAEDFAAQESERVNAELKEDVDLYERWKDKLLIENQELQQKLSATEQALENVQNVKLNIFKMKIIQIKILPNHRFGCDKSKGFLNNSKVIINCDELGQRENEIWEAELIDDKYKLLKRINP